MKKSELPLDIPTQTERPVMSDQIGFWSALITTILGIIYILLVAVSIVIGSFTFPPPEFVQISVSIMSLFTCIALVVLVASIHLGTHNDKNIFSLISLAFILLFAVSVSINRFAYLGVERLSIEVGNINAIERFLPYEPYSLGFALEYLGWAWFLSIAMLFLAPIYSDGRLQLWLRWSCVAYGILGLIGAIGHLLGNVAALVGFVAWGIVLLIIAALLIVYFKQKLSIKVSK